MDDSDIVTGAGGASGSAAGGDGGATNGVRGVTGATPARLKLPARLTLPARPQLVAALTQRTFDLLIIGGGITGAGIARDAALRGLDVALIDRGDFACGTSSRSSKLIHGGLRYLEQGDVGLVFEAVRERQRLLELAPHLAVPQSFVVPVFKDSRYGVLMLDLGLTIYDTLAAFSGVLRHKAMRRDGLLACEPLLRPEVRGGVRYFDAQTDDARLVMANIRGAHQAGAVCLSRVEFLRPEVEQGKIAGAVVRDVLAGGVSSATELSVKARVLVLAAGPFSDQVRARLHGAGTQSPPPRPMIKPSKGVHIVVPRSRLPLSEAVAMTAADGRMVFALRWPTVSVIGTTDTRYEADLQNPRTTTADADYLLATANATLQARGGPLQREDIVSTWAGIRPLAIGTRDDAGGTYKTSREHVLEADRSGIVTIAGGKLTTYRRMAAQAIDAALPLLPAERRLRALPCTTAELRLPGAEGLAAGRGGIEAMAAQVAREIGLPDALASHLAHNYGSDALAIGELARNEPGAERPVISGAPTRWAELDWVMDSEMPSDLVDLLVRRCTLYYSVGERVMEIAPALADRFCRRLGLPADRAPELVSGLQRHVEEGRLADPALDLAPASRGEPGALHVA